MACGFGVDGVEVDEPAFEKRPCHRLQRRCHPFVELNFVVEWCNHCGDTELLIERRKFDLDLAKVGFCDVTKTRCLLVSGNLNKIEL